MHQLLIDPVPEQYEFFNRLDRELEKINEFYKERESFAIHTWTKLKGHCQFVIAKKNASSSAKRKASVHQDGVVGPPQNAAMAWSSRTRLIERPRSPSAPVLTGRRESGIEEFLSPPSDAGDKSNEMELHGSIDIYSYPASQSPPENPQIADVKLTEKETNVQRQQPSTLINIHPEGESMSPITMIETLPSDGIPSPLSPFLSPFTSKENLAQVLQAAVASATGRPSYSMERGFRKQKRKLKKALLEFYRSLELLKNYKILNTTGFGKICKKYAKTVSEKHAPEFYLRYVGNSYFAESNVVDEMVKEIEMFYTRLWDGKRQEAMKELRLPDNKNQTYHSVVWRIGLYCGLALFPIWSTLDRLYREWEIGTVPYANTLLQIYAGFSVPIIFVLLFAANIFIWQKHHINYIFIFEFDARNHLTFYEFLEFGGLLLVIGSFCFYLTFHNIFASFIYYTSYPLIFAIIVLFLLFTPLPIFYRNARWWFLKSMTRILFSGIPHVEFRDFFMTDLMISTSYAFMASILFVCSYSEDFEDLEKNCQFQKWWVTPVMAALPLWWRFCQCLRRFYDTNYTMMHLVNTGKYFVSMCVVYFAAAYRIYKVPALWYFWILISIGATTYSYAWDILHDWGLFKKGSKNRFLRDDLGYPSRNFYYFAIVLNAILRLTWIILLSPSLWQSFVSDQAVLYFVALLEMVRRFVWNLLRMENEHLNNCGRFRATKDIPLPFTVSMDRVRKIPADAFADSSRRRRDSNDSPRDEDEDSGRSGHGYSEEDEEEDTDNGIMETSSRHRGHVSVLSLKNESGKNWLASGHAKFPSAVKEEEGEGSTTSVSDLRDEVEEQAARVAAKKNTSSAEPNFKPNTSFNEGWGNDAEDIDAPLVTPEETLRSQPPTTTSTVSLGGVKDRPKLTRADTSNSIDKRPFPKPTLRTFSTFSANSSSNAGGGSGGSTTSTKPPPFSARSTTRLPLDEHRIYVNDQGDPVMDLHVTRTMGDVNNVEYGRRDANATPRTGFSARGGGVYALDKEGSRWFEEDLKDLELHRNGYEKSKRRSNSTGKAKAYDADTDDDDEGGDK